MNDLFADVLFFVHTPDGQRLPMRKDSARGIPRVGDVVVVAQLRYRVREVVWGVVPPQVPEVHVQR